MRQVLLGVTGGIAAYKSLELVRLFRRAGWEVQVVMTRHARRLLGPRSFAALSGRPVASELFPSGRTPESGAGRHRIEHVDLAARADLVVVAPATANIIGKLAGGIADDLLSTLLLAVPSRTLRSGRVVLAPAMNVNMWQNPSVQENIRRLAASGYVLVGPEAGELACGETGQGRLAAPERIFAAGRAALESRGRIPDLTAVRVLVTAGRTEEPIDPVRILTNRSSGRMGIAIARAFATAGAQVRLIAGPVSVPLPQDLPVVSVQTADQMLAAVLEHLPGTEVLVMCAAVSDYRPARARKTKYHSDSLRLELSRTPDILSNVNRAEHSAVVVGFSLDPSIDRARQKLRAKGLDLVIANPYPAAGAVTTAPTFVYPSGRAVRMPEVEKESFAFRLVAETAKLLRKRN